MKKALLIIDVQTSAVTKPEIAQRIEKTQYEYETVYISKFTNTKWFMCQDLHQYQLSPLNHNVIAPKMYKGLYS